MGLLERKHLLWFRAVGRKVHGEGEIEAELELRVRFWIAREDAERHLRYGEQHKQRDRQRQD